MAGSMVTLPRRLHPHNRPHLTITSNLTRNQDEPAQIGVGSSLLNESTCLHQHAIKVRLEKALPDYRFNDNVKFASAFVNADDSVLRGPAYAG
jgi:hypothetical protein